MREESKTIEEEDKSGNNRRYQFQIHECIFGLTVFRSRDSAELRVYVCVVLSAAHFVLTSSSRTQCNTVNGCSEKELATGRQEIGLVMQHQHQRASLGGGESRDPSS